MLIPEKFEKILKTNQQLYSIVLDVITSFQPILDDNKLFFFEEYTDHGIKHIESVLKASEFIISDESFKILTPKEVALLILSIILHDIGMHTEYSTFLAMLNGDYDDVIVKEIDLETWSELWNEYLVEVKRFSSQQKKMIFGDEFQKIEEPDLTNKDRLNGYDKKLIGEFIRRHHARLAHEIIFKGLIGSDDKKIDFAGEKLSLLYRQLIGVIARSHGIEIRKTFDYLRVIGSSAWQNPDDVNIVFLMAVLRVADYIQIDQTRIEPILLKLKTFNSPISLKEHKAHLAITSINFKNTDPEKIFVLCNPNNAEMYVKLHNLFDDIQKELDISWAVLGEVYGFLNEKPNIKFRRITSNLDDRQFLEKLDYVPRKIGFEVNKELSKLLVAPLYGNKPTYGVRELLQNAVDACRERQFIEKQKLNNNYDSKIVISIDRVGENENVFKITDNGKGMNIDEILLYFLSVGTSFRKSLSWKKQFIDNEGNISVNRNGRFGIGVLAAFLIGEELSIKTKHHEKRVLYSFKAKIDSEYIEIKKEQDYSFDFGTEICIQMSNSQRENIINDKDYGVVEWNKWFIDNYPRVVYLVDGKEEVNYTKTERKGSITFSTGSFKNIEWIYKKRHSYDYNGFPQIVCNGIIIEKSGYHSFKLEDKGDIVREIPKYSFEDYEGLFPLRLDRNGIDCDILPFEKELFLEVCKSIIAQMLRLKLDVDRDGRYGNVSLLYHNMNVLYLNFGYSFDIDYFTKMFKTEGYRIIRIVSSRVKISKQLLNNITKSVFVPCETDIKLSSSEQIVAPSCGGYIILDTKKYNDLFLSDKNRISKTAKRNHKLHLTLNEYTSYEYKKFEKQSPSLETMLNLDLGDVDSIQELNYELFDNRLVGELFEEQLKVYFGDNFMIPYDYEERQKTFPKAFTELSKYMNALFEQHPNSFH